MSERPIIFSAPMVWAILEGRKTQTRRVVKPQPDAVTRGEPYQWEYHGAMSPPEAIPIPCPYGVPGDRLLVREAFQYSTDARGTAVMVYAADDSARFLLAEDGGEGDLCGLGGVADRSRCGPVDRWRSPIHMPRWASRLTLVVKAVRVERVQAISEGDAIAEGVGEADGRCPWCSFGCSRVEGFRVLWDSINGTAHPWESNPWVWVVEFQRAGGPQPQGEGGTP